MVIDTIKNDNIEIKHQNNNMGSKAQSFQLIFDR